MGSWAMAREEAAGGLLSFWMLPNVNGNRWPVKGGPGPICQWERVGWASWFFFILLLLIMIVAIYIYIYIKTGRARSIRSAQSSLFLNPRLDSRHTPRGRGGERSTQVICDPLLLRVIQRLKRSRLQQPEGGMMDRPNPPLSVINSFRRLPIDQMHQPTLFFWVLTSLCMAFDPTNRSLLTDFIYLFFVGGYHWSDSSTEQRNKFSIITSHILKPVNQSSFRFHTYFV